MNPGSREETLISVVDWFDVNDRAHVTAYAQLAKNGVWPRHFIPADVEMTQSWNIGIMAKLANAWVYFKTGPGTATRRGLSLEEEQPELGHDN